MQEYSVENDLSAAKEAGTPAALTWESLRTQMTDHPVSETLPILSKSFVDQYYDQIIEKVRENKSIFEDFVANASKNKTVEFQGNVLKLLLDDLSAQTVQERIVATVMDDLNISKGAARGNMGNILRYLHTQVDQNKKRVIEPNVNVPLFIYSDKTGQASHEASNMYVTFNPFYTPPAVKQTLGSPEKRKKMFLEKLRELLPENETVLETEIAFSFPEDKKLPNKLKRKKFTGKMTIQINEDNESGTCILGSNTYTLSEGYLFQITRSQNEENNSISLGLFNNFNTILVKNRYPNKYCTSQASNDLKNISTYFFPQSSPQLTISCRDEAVAALVRKHWLKYDMQTAIASFSSLPDKDLLKQLLNEEYNTGLVGGFLSFCIFDAIIDDFENRDPKSQWLPLPAIQALTPPRPVELKPFSVRKNLTEKNLRLSSSVINSATVALNSGNHIILTGSPGTGKTTLAQKLAQEAGCSSSLCTATPDWTTNELIGRYMPAVCAGNRTLEFQEGYFLQAIRNNQWLIIDELNRADIDSCMGCLFSVLSGHETILSYRVAVAVGENSVELADGVDISPDQKIEQRFVGICLEKQYEKLSSRDDVFWYVVPDSFRIICTMNDADAGMLNQLSFALLRRFSIVRVESPDPSEVSKIIATKTEAVWNYYKGNGEKQLSRKMLDDQCRIWLTQKCQTLFAQAENFDFLKSHIVGIGQVVDIIKMTVEGTSYSPEYNFKGKPEQQALYGLFMSVFANAVVMKILPQLSAFVHNQSDMDEIFKPALQVLIREFGKNEQNEYIKEYFLTADADEKLVIEEGRKTLHQYLLAELKLHFRNFHIDINALWSELSGE